MFHNSSAGELGDDSGEAWRLDAARRGVATGATTRHWWSTSADEEEPGGWGGGDTQLMDAEAAREATTAARVGREILVGFAARMLATTRNFRLWSRSGVLVFQEGRQTACFMEGVRSSVSGL